MKTPLPRRFTAMVSLLMLAISAICCRTAPVADEVTSNQFKAYVYGPQGYYSTMFRGVRYVGSDAHFDYIALTYADSVARSNLFKVRAGELGLKSHMSVKRNTREWVDVSAEFPFPLPATR